MRKTQKKRRLGQKHCPGCKQRNKQILEIARQNFITGYKAGLAVSGQAKRGLDMIEQVIKELDKITPTDNKELN